MNLYVSNWPPVRSSIYQLTMPRTLSLKITWFSHDMRRFVFVDSLKFCNNELFIIRLVCWAPSTHSMRHEFYYTFYQISGIDAPPMFKRLSQLSAMWLRHDSQIGSGTKRTLLERNGLLFEVRILLHILPNFGHRRASSVQEIITALSNVVSSRLPDWFWDKTNPFGEEWTIICVRVTCTRCTGTKRERSDVRLTPM